MNIRRYFSEEEKLQIINAIRVAEGETSGEIRVHIEKYCKGMVLDRAAYLFEQLKMHQTKLRNGVLFYLAIEDRKFGVIGDVGINAKVAENFWDEIKENVLKNFSDGRKAEGITEGILKAGEQLKQHFPHQTDDVNELPDEISFGD
ncbi:MAG: hypothetical protein CSA36_02785 [Draconibacterium sp.]|nr:MAG: hypothetical protein CSA36_02785 [Draconibacterium sp.]